MRAITELDEFLDEIKEYNPHADFGLIEKAYRFAQETHKGQKRHSGEEFFVHPLEVSKILIKLKADSATICASLLHDSVEDSTISIEVIKKEFGDEIAELVEGVTKIIGERFETKELYNAENIRKMLLATAKDIRVILIKLADRLNNMRTLRAFRPEKQKRIAQETLDIYAPIAHKLGIRFIKGELEDLSLKYLDPEAYQMLRKKISEKREEREAGTKEIIRTIKKNLSEYGIDADVQGRAKYFYSIYQKMKKRGVKFNEIYDLIAIRIITKTIPECYAVLGAIHELYKPIPGRFKDYISVPKANGYQSLHTSVLASHGKILEIQIRTLDMHLISEEGIAAHWRYKGTERDKKFDRKINWLKQVLDWKQESKTAEEFIDTLKIDLFENEIVVFTPKGDPISLPEKATPVDFAYEVHSNIGDHCSKAYVNNKLVPLDHILKSGDIIQIMTQKNASPSRGWLGFVKTAKARNKIRNFLNIKDDFRGKKTEKEKKAIAEEIDLLGRSGSISLSKCCNPEHEEPIIGILTKDKKITIHKKDCHNLAGIEKSKIVDAKWKVKHDKDSVKLKVVMKDRVGILSEILNILTNSNVNIHSIYTRTKKDHTAVTFKLQVPKEVDFNEVYAQLKSLKDIIDMKKENS